jgi:hypothetical protein
MREAMALVPKTEKKIKKPPSALNLRKFLLAIYGASLRIITTMD